MSRIFELSIPFKISRDYQRLLLITYGLGLISVGVFDYSFWVTIYLCAGIVAHGYHLFRIGKPHGNYATLRYHNRQWYLLEETGQEHCYQEIQILYDMRWIMCIVLKQDKEKRRILFFADQLTDEVRRIFYLLQLEQTSNRASTIFN